MDAPRDARKHRHHWDKFDRRPKQHRCVTRRRNNRDWLQRRRRQQQHQQCRRSVGLQTSWSLSQTLRASDKAVSDSFGGGVGFGGDNTLFIGAQGWDASYTDGANVGAVYEFSRTSGSASFIEQATMYPPESANYGGENLGFAAASSNGLTVLGYKSLSSTAYDVLVFRKTGGSWGLLKTLTLPSEWQGTSGSNVFSRYQYNAMNSSGSIYVVGAYALDGGAGRAFIFS